MSTVNLVTQTSQLSKKIYEAKEWINHYVVARKISVTEGNELYRNYINLLRCGSPLEIRDYIEFHIENND